MRCGYCKYWGNEKDKDELFRQRMKIYHGEKYGVDNDNNDPEFISNETLEFNRKIIANNMAVTQDGSGYMAVLRAKQDFGCILGEEK